MDSNFQYAGAVNLVVGPFGWVVLCDRVRVRARRFWDSAVSATRLGDLSRRHRGGPPHRSIDEGSGFRIGVRERAPDRAANARRRVTDMAERLDQQRCMPLQYWRAERRL